MKNRIYYADVENGELLWHSPQEVEAYLKAIDGLVAVTIVKKKKVRTITQNSYYWLLLDTIGAELGYDPNDLHNTFKSMYLIDNRGTIPIIHSTSDLSPEEMGMYIEKIIQLAYELMPDIILPKK